MDALLHTGGTVHAVMDAKYKSLRPTAAAPNGPQREDLYQMAAYLSRYTPTQGRSAWGALIYPQVPIVPMTIPPAEQYSPWSFSDGKKIAFTTLPHDAIDAVAKMRALIASMAPAHAASARR
jgi:5-methylcytosine-specific restriction enzyme subunit McrC